MRTVHKRGDGGDGVKAQQRQHDIHGRQDPRYRNGAEDSRQVADLGVRGRTPQETHGYAGRNVIRRTGRGQ